MTGKVDPYGKGHRHKYSGWVLSRSPLNPKEEMTDKEYIGSITIPPMWKRECSCGFKEFVRMSSKPSTKLKFRDLPRRLL
mgnify:CR=1 FL=1